MLNMLLRSELLGADSQGRGAQPHQGMTGVGGGLSEATTAGRRGDGGRGGAAAGICGGIDGGGVAGGALTPSPNVFRFKVGSKESPRCREYRIGGLFLPLFPSPWNMYVPGDLE